MIEYEYSKVVDDLKKYIDYCENNGFILINKVKQDRTIYRNQNKTIARITINIIDDLITKELDFKEDKITNNELIARKESLPIEFTDDEAVNSILDFLNYQKDNRLIRTRYVYVKNNIKFELDEYVEPNVKKVISLEGKKKTITRIWNEIK